MPVKPKSEEYDGAVLRAATAISEALTKMIADLPQGSAPEMALESIVEQLAPLEAWQLIMEDPDVVEAYLAAAAAIPATAGK
jgi:hypothetical protein